VLHDLIEVDQASLENGREAAPTAVVNSGHAAAPTLRILTVGPTGNGRNLLTRLLRTNSAVSEVFTATDIVTALRPLSRVPIDAVFIDADLPDFNSFELAQVLRQFANQPAIVFVADGPAHAAMAFEVGAIDYLLKPVAAPRLVKTLERVRPARHAALAQSRTEAVSTALPAEQSEEFVMVSLAGTVERLPRSSVRWMEARRGYTQLHTASGRSWPVGVALSSLAQDWSDAGFVQIHRSYVVQLAAISELRRTDRSLTVVVAGQELPVSRRYAQQLRRVLFQELPVRKLSGRPKAIRESAGSAA